MPSLVRRPSFDSARPILETSASYHASNRISTYSTTVSEPSSEMTFNTFMTSNTYVRDIRDYTTAYERLECKRMVEQRYMPSPQKEGYMAKVALLGKVQRALDRRFRNQDAVFRPRVLSEKAVLA